jgi:ubiquinone/menaquinone biosynthesis C-methylase UbiE
MSKNFVTYNMDMEEYQRERGWYLSSRDRFVVALLKREYASPAGTEMRVLDVGCGTGGVSHRLAAAGYRVTSVDADPDVLLWGKHCGRLSNPIVANVTSLQFPDGAFDVSICSEVVEHVEDDVKTLQELLRVSRRGVLLTVPAHGYLWTDSDHILLHRRRYNDHIIRKLVTTAGGDLRKIHAYAVIPALGVVMYKAIRFCTHFLSNADACNRLPLSIRHPLPVWMNRLLGFLFQMELWLSCRGLIPWGHGYWFVVEKKRL